MRDFCPFCKNPLVPWYEWKASDGRLYCNEFCADAGEATAPLVPETAQFQQDHAAPRA